MILGCANQAGEDNRNVARMASLLAELPIKIGGETVNRLCASEWQQLPMPTERLQLEKAILHCRWS